MSDLKKRIYPKISVSLKLCHNPWSTKNVVVSILWSSPQTSLGHIHRASRLHHTAGEPIVVLSLVCLMLKFQSQRLEWGRYSRSITASPLLPRRECWNSERESGFSKVTQQYAASYNRERNTCHFFYFLLIVKLGEGLHCWPRIYWCSLSNC